MATLFSGQPPYINLTARNQAFFCVNYSIKTAFVKVPNDHHAAIQWSILGAHVTWTVSAI